MADVIVLAVRVGVTALDPILWIWAILLGSTFMLIEGRYRWLAIVSGGIGTGSLLAAWLNKGFDVGLTYALASMLQMTIVCIVIAARRRNKKQTGTRAP